MDSGSKLWTYPASLTTRQCEHKAGNSTAHGQLLPASFLLGCNIWEVTSIVQEKKGRKLKRRVCWEGAVFMSERNCLQAPQILETANPCASLKPCLPQTTVPTKWGGPRTEGRTACAHKHAQDILEETRTYFCFDSWTFQ